MSKTKSAIIFIVGAAAGYATAFIFQKRKYEAILEKETEGFREALKKCKETTKKIEPAKTEEEKKAEDIEKVNSIITENNYIPPEPKKKSKPKTVKASDVSPKVISINEFTKSKYEKVNITCYADGTYAEDGFQIDDPSDVFGEIDLDSLMKEKEIYILNPEVETAYDILYDPRTYEEAEEDGDFDRR